MVTPGKVYPKAELGHRRIKGYQTGHSIKYLLAFDLISSHDDTVPDPSHVDIGWTGGLPGSRSESGQKSY